MVCALGLAMAVMTLDGREAAFPAEDESREPPLLDDTVEIERIVSGCRFTEGPAVDSEGQLFFSDGPNDRILKWTEGGKLEIFRHPCGRANGLTFDRQGRLLICQSRGPGGGRKVTRLEKDGSETILCDQFEGSPLNAPNDLCVDPRDRIFFTDPAPSGQDSALAKSRVFRIDAPGKVACVIDDLWTPNGIAVTPDGKTLYVSDRGTQKLHRYRIHDDGTVESAGIVYDFSPDRGIDGMRLDAEGRIWAAAGQNATTGLFVLSDDGKLLLHKPMPEFSTNLCFGGPDGKTLYFTASTSVYRLRTRVPGVAWRQQ